MYIIEIDIKQNNDKVDKSGETFGLYTLTDRQVAVINRFDVGSSAGYFSLEPGTRSDPYGGYSGAESYIGTNDHPFTSMYSYTTNGNYGNSVVNVNYLNSNFCVYGSNANGEYLKYDNGTLICWKRIAVSNVNITTAWGNCYESDRIQLGAPPHVFKTGTAPRTFLSTEDINAVFEAVQSKSATDFGNTRFWRPTQASNQSGAIYVFAIGNWK